MVWLVPVALVVLLALGAPVAVAIFLPSLMYLASPDIAAPLTIAPLRMVTALSNFLLIAVPLFILFGEIMSATGLTDRLVRFVQYLVGWLRAGLAQINVAMSMLFGGMSGLAMADAAAIGSVLIPSMKRAGYPAAFSAAVTGASSVVGPVIPPSVPAVIYGVISGVSIAGLFAAGILPGILLGIAFMFTVALWARRPGRAPVSSEPFTLQGLGSATLQAFPALLAPVIVLVGIFTGVFTATEASAIAVAYSVLLGFVVYRTLSIRALWTCCVRTVQLTGVVLFIFGVAAILSWAVGRAGLARNAVQWLAGVDASPTIFLLLLGLVLVLVGMVLDPTAAMIILVPLIAPLAPVLGVDPLHLGMIVVLSLSLGLITPPIGYVLYIVSELADDGVERIVRQIAPFLLAALLVTVLVITVPGLTTWLPELILG